ncbi:MAG TPA: hypothetical protein VEI97_08475, partial [bacterium]|nr:hypothetical protein [bacterium]
RGSATLDLTYAVSHPFAAPTDLNAPPTATNRADLSISGRVLFLTDVPSATGNAFFTGNGDVVANTEWVVNADAYYQPAGLLNLAGFTANTFPYKVLVDEAQDPRIGTATGAPISNGSNPRGNYSPTDGWQHHNIGPNNDGWTGFGVLHQGQTAFNDLRLALAPLTANPFQLQVAILAKYVDPRGGATAIEKRANRLPSNPPDITRFVYREPHGALDVERITFLGESGGFEPNIASGSTLRFHVVDWDARTPETTLPDLAQDPDPTHVATGESGFPALAVSIPGVLGDTTAVYDFTSPPADDDSAHGGDPGPDSGEPTDALFYEELVTKTIDSGQTAGTYTGMVRALDPEIAADTSSWKFPLRPDLTPANPAPDPIAYQAFQVLMATPSDPPTVTLTTPREVLSGETTTIEVTAATDPDGDTILLEIDWDNDGIFEDTQRIEPPYDVPVTLTRPDNAIYANPT